MVKSVGIPRLSYTRAVHVSQESACYFYCINKTSSFHTQLKKKKKKKKQKECGHCNLEVGENLASATY